MEVNDRARHMSAVDLCDSCHAAARLDRFQMTRISDRGQAVIHGQTKARLQISTDFTRSERRCARLTHGSEEDGEE